MALLEPLIIDTLVMCTMTALIIVISGSLQTGLTGVQLISVAFASAFTGSPNLLALTEVLFAFATMISWSCYGRSRKRRAASSLICSATTRRWRMCTKICVVICASMSLGLVIDFSDSMIFAMAIPNVIGLCVLMPVVRRKLAQYREKMARGEIRRFR